MKKIGISIGAALLLAGCTVEEEPKKTRTPVTAAEIPGDMTYQDVLQEGEHVQSVAMSPATSRIWLGTNSGLYASASDKLWVAPSPDVASDDITGWFADPANPGHMYIVGNGLCKRSEDGGKTWQAVGEGFPMQSEVRGFTGGRDGNQLLLFASVSGEGIYLSTDRGNSWKLWQQPNQDVSSIDYDQQAKKLYAISQNGLLVYSTGQWQSETVPDAQRIASIAVSKQDNQLYVLTNNGIMVKQRGNWEPIPVNAPESFVMIASGSVDQTLIAMGESASIYTLEKGKWMKWE